MAPTNFQNDFQSNLRKQGFICEICGEPAGCLVISGTAAEWTHFKDGLTVVHCRNPVPENSEYHPSFPVSILFHRIQTNPSYEQTHFAG